MASIRIPTPLRVYTDNEAQVEADGATVGELLQSLVQPIPGFRTASFQ